MVNAKVGLEVQNFAPSAIVDLYELDATMLYDTNNVAGEIVRFHAGTNGIEQIVVWQGNEYTPFPIEVVGFEANTKGTIPRPTLRVANIGEAITTLLIAFDNLIGAKITRKRTFAKFLDAINFNGGNPNADTNAAFADEIYYVSRKASENEIFVELELSPAWDLHGIQLPRRLCVQNVCSWKYKGLECGYGEIAEFAALNLPFTASATTGITITSTAHPLLLNSGIHVKFTGGNAGITGTYNIRSITANSFTIYPYAIAESSGTVDVTNRFDLADTPIYANFGTMDRCARRLESCKIRWSGDTVLPYGGFPGVGWIG